MNNDSKFMQFLGDTKNLLKKVMKDPKETILDTMNYDVDESPKKRFFRELLIVAGAALFIFLYFYLGLKSR